MLTAKQESETKTLFMRGKVETVIWTERMLAALISGVKGGKWFSLWDKVWRSSTLERAWELVSKNKGAGGVDGVTIERFKGMKDKCLKELAEALKNGIPKDKLMDKVRARIADGKILDLVQAFLDQSIMEECRTWTPTKGTPAGAVLSPLLANIYLHDLDVLMTSKGYRMVRYADDFVTLCSTEEEANKALEEVKQWMTENGLMLHPDKTHIGNCTIVGQGFEFLGYRFECGKRTVRKTSMKKLRDTIRRRTKRTVGQSMESVIASLNPTLRGWFGYFKHAHKWTFKEVDGFVRRRLRAILRKQDKRPGMGRCLNDHMQWRNTYFATLGLFTMREAHAELASRSR